MVENILTNLKASSIHTDHTFLQAVSEVLYSLDPIIQSDPRYERNAILERLVTPDRIIQFRDIFQTFCHGFNARIIQH